MPDHGELIEEFIVIHAAGYPDPVRPHPNTRESAHRFASEGRRLPEFPATVRCRMVSPWVDDLPASSTAEPEPTGFAPGTTIGEQNAGKDEWGASLAGPGLAASSTSRPTGSDAPSPTGGER